MVCFDYEEVECVSCKEKFMDGYSVINEEKSICDECLEKTLVKIEKFGCFYSPETKSTYPANVDGTADLFNGMEVPLKDIICDERDDIIAEINRITGENNE